MQNAFLQKNYRCRQIWHVDWPPLGVLCVAVTLGGPWFGIARYVIGLGRDRGRARATLGKDLPVSMFPLYVAVFALTVSCAVPRFSASLCHKL